MKLLYFILLVVFATAIKKQIDDDDSRLVQLGSSAMSEYKDLQSTDLGQMFVDFAQVELQTSGAVDILNEVMKAFGRQLDDRLQQEIEMFDARLGDHNSKSLQLESLVNQAELDIVREKKTLNQELTPRSQELDDILVALRLNKDNTAESVSQSKLIRKEQSVSFNTQANEISEAIRAVDEALESIKGMMNDNSGQSLLQVSSEDQNVITQNIHNIKVRAEKVGKFFGSFLQALSKLSEGQNFSDRQVIKQLVDLLNNLRTGFLDTLQKAYSDEDQQKMLNEQRLTQLQKELDVFAKQYADAVQEREEKSVRIQDTQNSISTRSIELTNYQDRLTIENNNFSMNQKIHDDLVVSINSQIGIIEKSIDQMASPQMIDILQAAMNKA